VIHRVPVETGKLLDLIITGNNTKPAKPPAPFLKSISDESQLSLVSDKTDGTPVYKQVKQLFKKLAEQNETKLIESNRLAELVNQTMDSITRFHLEHHQVPNEIKDAVQKRFQRNYGHQMVHNNRFDMIPDSFDGLYPDVDIPTIRSLLKAQEVFDV
jgi:hypothetical protein